MSPQQHRRPYVLRTTTFPTALAVVAALTFVPAFQLPARAAEPGDVATLRAGLGSVAQVFIGEYEEAGPLAQPVPLSDTSAGADVLRPGDALSLEEVMEQGVTDKLVDLMTSDEVGSVAALAQQVDTALDGTVAGSSLQVSAGNVVSGAGGNGFDVTLTVSKTTDAAVALTDPSGPGGKPVTLRSPATAPFNLSFTFAAKLRTNDAGDRFWLEAGPATPSLSLKAGIAGAGAYSFPEGEAAIGVGDIDIIAGSTADLDATWAGSVSDTNGDGRLTIAEPTLDGTGQTPGELTMPAEALTAFAPSGSATAAVKLGSGMIPLDASPAPTMTLNADLGTTSNLAADLVASTGDLADMAAFTRISAVDLVSGLVQYSTTLRALQTHPNVDANLPLAGGRLSDLHDLGAAVGTLADDLIEIEPFDNDADPTDDTTPQVVKVKVQTIEDLADKIDGLPGFSGGALQPTYDSATQRVTMNVKFAQALDGLATLDLPTGSEVAQLTFGDQLRASTGLRGVTRPDDSPVDPKVDVAFDVDLPILIDLAPAAATTDDPDTSVVEFEAPMVFERFETKLQDGPEADLTFLVDGGAEGRGQIGFVPATLGGTYKLLQDGTNPTTAVDVDPASGQSATPRLVDLMAGIAHDPANSNPAEYPVAAASRHIKVDADLTVNGHGARTQDVLTASPGTVTVDGTGFDATAYTTALTNDQAKLLKSLDVDVAEPSRLLGRIIDTADGAADSLASLDAGLDAVGLDVPKIPLIEKTAGDLLAKAVDLKGKIDAIRSGPTPVDLAEVETKLQDLVKNGNSDPALHDRVKFALRDDDPADGTVDPSLVLRFDIDKSDTVALPLSLDVSGLPNLTSSGNQGNVNATLAGSLDLGVVVPLNAEGTATPPLRILDSSELSVTGSITESEPGAAQLSVNLGVLSAQLGDSTNKTGRLGVGAKVTVGHDDAPAPGASGEEPVSLADFFDADLDVTPSSADPGGTFTCTPPGGLAPTSGTYGCASLPVLTTLSGQLKTLGGSNPDAPAEGDYLKVEINSLTSAPSVTAPANLSAVIDSMDFSFDGLGDGFDALSKILQVAIAASTVGGDLPLVGEDLSKLAGGLTTLKNFLDNPGDVLNLPFDTDPTVEEVLFASGGLRDKLHSTLSTAGILRDSSYPLVYPADPDAAKASDIRLVPVCGGALCALTADITTIDEIRVELELGQGSRASGAPGADCSAGNGTPCPGEVDIPIDLGLDGLPLTFKASTPAKAKAGWTLELGFGLSRDDGFYLLDNPVPGTGTPDAEPTDGPQEIRVNAGIDLFPAADSKLQGTIGFIGLEASDNKSGSASSGAGILAQVGIDAPGACAAQVAPYDTGLTGAYCTGKILGSQLLTGDPSQYLTGASLQGGIDLDLALKTGVGGPNDTINKTLPTFVADFKLKWQFGVGTDSSTPASLPDPEISLEHIGVDAGELFHEMFGGVFGAVGEVLEPTQEVRDFLFTPIPVISDISEYFGQGTIAMIDIARAFGVADTRLLKDINEVLDFIAKIATLGSGPMELIDKLEINPDEAMGPAGTPDQVSDLWDDSALPVSGLEDKVEEVLGDVGDEVLEAFNTLGAAEGGDGEDFTYPVFDDPSCLVGLLFGSDCVIVEWRPDPLHVKASYPLSFGPFFGVLYVTFGGEVEANGNFGGGVSTRGIRMLGERLIAGEAGLDAGAVGNAFFQSLYLVDHDRSGKDVPEFEVIGRIKVGAKFDALIVAAGVDGGIEASFSLNLNDTPQADGKMYIDEIIEKLKTPICLFDIKGKVSAFLEVWARFGVCPFCYTETWRLATVTLFEWSNKCNPERPDLAREIGAAGDRTVRLNVGDEKAFRGSFTGPEYDGEAYVVRQLTKDPDSNGEFKFQISAFGYTEEHTGERVEFLNSAAGDDSFLFQGGGNGTGTWPFTARVDGKLGNGKDNFVSGHGNDTVEGNDGDDVINVGDGTNKAWGDTTDTSQTGGDSLIGGKGIDELYGGPGNDVIDGGPEADKLHGNGGIDKIQGGRDITGVPTGVTPPPGSPVFLDKGDEIVGGGGNDTLNGGPGNDTMFGDEKTALAIDADELGEETVDGEAAGNDKIEGGAGEDDIWGGRGTDEIYGGFILASDGVDNATDEIQGNGGDDRLFGSAGDDKLWGGPQSDRIFGDDGDDDGSGQSGNDPEVRGGPGGDQLWGNGGADSLFGDGGDDEIIGDGPGAALSGSDPDKVVGDDKVDGGQGADIVLGDNGTVSGPVGSRVASPSQADGVGDSSLGGGPGDDRIYGEGGNDTLYGGDDRDLLHGNDGEDVVHGQTGADEAWGDADHDTLYGGTSDDVVFGNAADDDVHGQEGSDLLVGGHADPAGKDTGDHLFGGPDDDRIYGDDVTIDKGANSRFDASDAVSFEPSGDSTTYGDDVADGGSGRDEIHGQDGEDDLWGAEDADQIFGELGSDDLHGEGGPDYLLGDRGTITPGPRDVVPPAGGWKPGTPQGSPVLTVTLVAPNDGSQDFIWGDFNSADDPWSTGGDDHAWGGAGDDVMRGGAHDDTMEGNNGQDRMFGFDEDSDHPTDGEDDLIGGSSPVNPLAKPDGANSAPDEGEVEMQGNGQEDVMAGDNAVVTRVADPNNPAKWKVDPVTGGVFRTLKLLDTEKSGAALDLVSGGDYMVGNDENDRMFGEGANDLVKGNAHDDLVEGNQGGDWLEGNDDEDDLVGGSSFPDQPDEGDVLWGGQGADVLAGDNTCLVRQANGVPFNPTSCEKLDTPAPTAFHYVTSQLGVQTPRGVVLHDLDGPVATEYGADQLNGGQGVDVEFGQDGTDFVFGDGGGDFQFGNGHQDVVVGDRSVGAYGGIALPPEVGGTLPALPPLPSGLPGAPSTGEQLVGPAQADGQDDQMGGSNRAGHRDTGDWIFGDGEADFQLGDNGELNRTIVGDHYDVYEERYAGNNPPANAVLVRDVTRFDVGAAQGAGVWGADLMFGGNGTNPLISQGAGDGDDSQWGQDGNDKLFGEDGNDDQFGELGDDTMWGGAGEDAMVGDRGGVQTRFVEADGSDANDPLVLTHNSLGPPGINLGGLLSGPQDATLKPFVAHPLDRRTSLSHDRDGSVLAQGGNAAGGNDTMRGGPGHDSMHGADGDDLMNGDSGGDYAYGDDGKDVMWGGRGRTEVLSPDIPTRNAMGANGEWIDILFGGYGSSATEAGADILDYQPRAGVDPAVWFTMVLGYADSNPENAGVEGRQHHHGTDWLYGGWDRDVLQGDVAANGPNDGDKLLDWNGAYNLYTHCNAAYGGWNDVRKVDPNNILGLERLAYVTGATADFTGRPVLADVQTPGTSAFREVAIVYNNDLKNNSGKAFSSTPGHFEEFICSSD